jgi:hypothetical protein
VVDLLNEVLEPVGKVEPDEAYAERASESVAGNTRE